MIDLCLFDIYYTFIYTVDLQLLGPSTYPIYYSIQFNHFTNAFSGLEISSSDV